MPAFRYLAVNAKGERVSGDLKAEAMEGAIRELQSDGHTIISLLPVDRIGGGEDTVSARLARFVHGVRTHIPLRDVVFFTRQLATMFSAGMTLERAVGNLIANEANPRLKKILLALAADLQKGQSLSEAMGRHPGAFNGLYVSLIKAGEAGGSLGNTLESLADYLERSEEVRRKVVSSLYYPVFVMVFLSLCVAILVLKIAPMFDRVYRSFGADLPVPTRILMNVSGFLIKNMPFGILMGMAIAFGIFLFALTDRGRWYLDAARLRLPIFGALMKDATMANFSRTFGLLLASSVPVVDSLALAGRTVGNVLVRKGVETVRDQIKDGQSIHAAMRRAMVFPAILIQLVATGEETGEVEKLLLKAAEYYEKKVDTLISRLSSLIEPVLIVLMGGVVGALVIVIYLPIFYLGMAMKRGMR
jgi:type IV pilus assembly protein PilC